ncbi:hypothetical protein [Microbacterium atlanticum]|uniref:hypothetical protein n=1 Tax=Microbacterium atlanticum TaxID=2782168 RepID=UPI0018885B4A|nr:hypothetical protein [Microbacterium atlanticum]
MLALNHVIRRARRTEAGDGGAVLVTVVVVMFVGFLVAATIAASVVATVSANSTNKSNTSSFISAESGRDAALSNLASAIDDGTVDCAAVKLSDSMSTTDLTYTYGIRVTDVASPMPTDYDALGASAEVCPTLSTKHVVIRSTGTVGDATTTIDSVYPWNVVPETQPAGTVAYFDGQFKATKTTYEGDLVIRDSGDYECNNSAGDSIDGDLWVLRGSVRVTGPCEVTGSIYAYGLVEVKNKDLVVGGDIITETGDIDLTPNSATIGGSLYSGRNVILTKDGTVGVDIKARGTITSPFPAGWKKPDGTAIPRTAGAPVPTFTPTLTQVFDATAWIELGDWSSWATDAEYKTGLCSAGDQKPFIESTGTRVVFDLTGCGSSVKVAPGSVSVKRDVLYLVPAASQMDLELTGSLTKGAGDPQVFVVHKDVAQDSPTRPSTCPKGADKLAIGTGIAVRTMIYSPCGISNTMSLTMTGQLYMGGVGLHLNGGTFTCTPMQWKPAIPSLSCGVKGAGGIFDPSRKDISLGDLLYQTER